MTDKLPALEWDRKTVTWLGDWYADPLLRGVWRRLVIEGPANIATASVCTADDGFVFGAPVYPRPEEVIFPTIEEAKAACERALLAAGDVQ